jgi:hypothetical protein
MDKRVKQLLSLACVGVFTLVMAGTSRAQNLLYDPGFEQGLTAPNPNPTGIQGWSTFGGANFLTTPLAHSGTNVMDTPDNGGGYSVPGAYEVFAASAGQTFVLSGWVYTPNLLVSNSNDFAILQLSFFTGAPPSNYGGGTALSVYGVDIGTPIGPTPSTVGLPQGVWTYASVTGVAANQGLNHVNSVGAYLLDINADANADFYFDDMSLTIVPEPSTVALVLTSLFGGFLFLRKRRK